MSKKIGTRTAPAAESKRDKFIRLAERRTSVALRSIKLIGNLSNKNNYDYMPADTKKIVAALSREVEEMRRRFENPGGRSVQDFKL